MELDKIGKKILKLRKDNGYTQAQLACRVSVSPQAVSKWENGDAVPDVEMIGALATLFHVSTDYLLMSSEELCTDAGEYHMNGREVISDPIDRNIDNKESKDNKANASSDDGSELADKINAMKTRYSTLRTVRWTSLVAPIVGMLVLLGFISFILMSSYNDLISEVGQRGAIVTTTIVVCVSVLLCAQYVLCKTAMKYRLFNEGYQDIKYPTNASKWLLLGVKTFCVGIGRYLIAVKLLFDENKKIVSEIKSLREEMVKMHIL